MYRLSTSRVPGFADHKVSHLMRCNGTRQSTHVSTLRCVQEFCSARCSIHNTLISPQITSTPHPFITLSLTAVETSTTANYISSMAPPGVEAAVQSALANQQYDRIAAVLDAAELEVGYLGRFNMPGISMKRKNTDYHRVSCLSCLVLQSSNPNVLLQWPHALHILGLIYNQQL